MTEESKTNLLGVCVDQSPLSCRYRGFEGWLAGWTQTEDGDHVEGNALAPHVSLLSPLILVCARCLQIPFLPFHTLEKFLFRTGTCCYTVILVQPLNQGPAPCLQDLQD